MLTKHRSKFFKHLNYFLVVPILLSVACSPEKPVDCARYKEGTFKATYKNKEALISRKGNIQTERSEPGREAVFNVEWKDDCTYVLIPTTETINLFHWTNDFKITVNITAADEHSYTCVAVASNSPLKVTTRMEKIN